MRFRARIAQRSRLARAAVPSRRPKNCGALPPAASPSTGLRPSNTHRCCHQAGPRPRGGRLATRGSAWTPTGRRIDLKLRFLACAMLAGRSGQGFGQNPSARPENGHRQRLLGVRNRQCTQAEEPAYAGPWRYIKDCIQASPLLHEILASNLTIGKSGSQTIPKNCGDSSHELWVSSHQL